ncbi:hypothetical protein [Peribacillus frigoritolerans]|uniref:hypothetical protein n=1 Tax=Peribacillus frigoritolerans TaxID=450367 RepID=UPI003F7FE175
MNLVEYRWGVEQAGRYMKREQKRQQQHLARTNNKGKTVSVVRKWRDKIYCIILLVRLSISTAETIDILFKSFQGLIRFFYVSKLRYN